MKKIMFTVITVAAIILFTACTKSVDRPAGSANTVDSKMFKNKPVNTAAGLIIIYTGEHTIPKPPPPEKSKTNP